jgi:hypothetical protein
MGYLIPIASRKLLYVGGSNVLKVFRGTFPAIMAINFSFTA